MATLVPPPSKRQRVEHSEKSRIQQDVEAQPDPVAEDAGDIRLELRDETTNKATGPPIIIALKDANLKNLTTLANQRRGSDTDQRVTYRFSYYMAPEDGEEGVLHEGVPSDLLRRKRSNLSNGSDESSPKKKEPNLVVRQRPEAVFRVHAPSRCCATIAGHGEPILTLAFSPDSSTMTTGSGDNTARIWDLDTGTPKHTLKGHTGWVLDVAYSPDGNMIATGSKDHTIRLWNAKTGAGLGGSLKAHSNRISSLAWEPYHLQKPGNPRLASASKDRTVRIWNAVLRRTETTLAGHTEAITCVCWGGTGKIYTGSRDRTIRVWNPESGSLLQTLADHSHWVNHLALSTDSILRTAFHDHSRNIPETADGKAQKAKERFEAAAKVDGQIKERLVSASEDNTLYLWEPEVSQKPITRMLGHSKLVNHVAFSPDGMYVASAAFDNLVKIWSSQDGKFIHTLRGHVGPVFRVCFSADSRLLVSASSDTTVKVWNTTNGTLSMNLPGHKGRVFAVGWSSDGEKVGSGGEDKAVKLWRN